MGIAPAGLAMERPSEDRPAEAESRDEDESNPLNDRGCQCQPEVVAGVTQVSRRPASPAIRQIVAPASPTSHALLSSRLDAVCCEPFDAGCCRHSSPSMAPSAKRLPSPAPMLPVLARATSDGPLADPVYAALQNQTTIGLQDAFSLPTEATTSSPDGGLFNEDWRMVLYRDRNLVLYNPNERPPLRYRRLPIEEAPGSTLSNSFDRCPLCRQTIDGRFAFVAQAYFDLLAELHRDTARSAASGSTCSPEPRQGSFKANPFLMDEPTFCAVPVPAAVASEEGADAEAAQEAAAAAALRHLPPSLLNTGYYNRVFLETGKLGSGAGGAVFLCRHVLDDLTLGDYAVKKVPVGDNKAWLRDMIREVKTFERLHHPNIVDYKHSWLELSRSSPFCPFVPFLFILMQYCNGGSLEELIWHDGNLAQAKPSLPTSHIWCLLVDILLGLQHLHRQGILHRDLKPTNILLQWPEAGADSSITGVPRALLSDFGTAAPLGEPPAGKARGYTGTVEYTAPELLRGESGYDEKSDMWSLGIVLYAMCFASVPWSHDDPKQLKMIIGRFIDEHDDDASLWLPPDTSGELGDLRLVAAALLAFEPTRRPSADNLFKNPAFRIEAMRHASAGMDERRWAGTPLRELAGVGRQLST